MKITVGFSTRKTLLAWLIRKAERTPYSHVYVRYWNPFIEEHVVLHAAGFNVHFSTLDRFLAEKNIIIQEYDIPLDSKDQLKAIIKFSTRMAGASYGSTQLLGMGWARILKGMTNKSHKNPFKDGEKTMVCSEFVAHILNLAGYKVDLALAEVDGPAWVDKSIQANSK